ncbi:uncharacterized protein LOC132728648 isoform X2 [Ruditapes philippinarum]|uniref:uncharacterized protein LOC132728648 isoform X2 n=1 Tax=Ruditapes philippinarum TaxID=129788 RepID=UPI00295C10E8|nr:uncharacterized protein LOC132728648 isoform X2 [Ruditapes philippinarum]XP_060570303.1 uncharacterized protein LOC132728648 isoform X2 [Ruditapes philippinarum]
MLIIKKIPVNDQSFCIILGVYVDTIHEKNVPKMDDTEDERAPLLRKQERLERQIISEINRVDARVDELLPHADSLSETTNRYFGEDGKVLRKKRPFWKRFCCCCCG